MLASPFNLRPFLSYKAQVPAGHAMRAALEQEEAVPVWRTLESHTRLVLVHGARRPLQIDTDPPRLRSMNISENAEYEYAKYDLVSVGLCTLPALKYRRTRGTAYQWLSLYGF
jgi:hypothetical protein